MKIFKSMVILLFLLVLILTILFSCCALLQSIFDFSPVWFNILTIFFGSLGIFATMVLHYKIFKIKSGFLSLFVGLILSLLVILLTIFFNADVLSLFNILKIFMIILSSILGGLVGSTK